MHLPDFCQIGIAQKLALIQFGGPIGSKAAGLVSPQVHHIQMAYFHVQSTLHIFVIMAFLQAM